MKLFLVSLILGLLLTTAMILGLLVFTGAIAVPSPLHAQTAQSAAPKKTQDTQSQTDTVTPVTPPPSSNWAVNCATVSTRLDCSAISRVPLTKTGQGVLTVAVRISPETNQPTMLLLLPLGLHLPAGATLEFAGNPAKKLAFLNCHQAGCLTEHTVSAAEIDSLVKGQGPKVSVQMRDGQRLSVQVPAAGFSAAYAKIK